MPSKNIPVNGWPQIKELDIAAPILAELDKIEAWQKSVKQETKTGSEVTFTNALALDAVSLSAEIEVSQDLHGYSHPWAGGADVNKFDISNATMAGLISAFGLTAAKDSDGYITITGTYTGESDAPKFAIIPTLPVLADAVFYLMDKNTDANNNVIQCRWANAETGGVAIDLQNMVQNQTYNIKFHLMIVTDGTVPASYRPYSNICPISGRTSNTISQTDADEQTTTVTIQLGTTVYGGTLNVTTGVLTVDRVVETKTVTSVYANASNPNCDFAVLDALSNAFILDNTTRSRFIFNAVCIYEIGDTFNNVSVVGRVLAYSTVHKQLAISAPKGATLSDMQALFGSVQVCYPLATPQTIQLTPTQLTMLKGYNRLSADTGNIEVTAYTGNKWN